MLKMLISFSILVLSFTLAFSAPMTIKPSNAFLDYWKSGLAEISSYQVKTERYGEMREGQEVMIFVYEEINADTRIKVESDKTPVSKQVPVLKLNHVLKFNTGIYDYSVLTSVFTGLAGQSVKRPFDPQKISLTAQEWCGHVYHSVEPHKSGIVSEIHSYFEKEGNTKITLPFPVGTLYYEDEFPILFRELDGEFLKTGENLKSTVLPSLWLTRKRHQPLTLAKAEIHKEKTTLPLQNKNWECFKWTVELSGIKTEYWIEKDFPHKVLAWKNSVGESGELINSLRKTYWALNHNKDLGLRKELGLHYGLGD